MLEYEVRGKMVVILGCSKDETDIDIPETIEGLPVSKIEPNAFAEMDNLVRIVVPGTCKVIGNYAFAACENLKELIIEEGVEIIEDWAFISCALMNISLPKSLKSVGQNAFLGNMIKSQVDDFMNKKDGIRRAKAYSNNKCAVFPISFTEKLETITAELIQNRSKYIDTQMEAYLGGELELRNFDLPFVFDNSEFVIAIYNRKPLEDLTLELPNEVKSTIGLYLEDDPEFIPLRVNVLTKGQFITSFTVKTPYLEAASFDIVNIEKIEEKGMYYYFLHLKANLSCFGNGNYDREFSLNQYDELLGKFETLLANQMIKEDQFNEFKERLEERIMITMNGFLAQIDGAPLMTYVMDIYRHALEDQSLEKSDELNAYVYEKIMNYYATMNDYDSFEDICFNNIDETIEFITSLLGLSLEEINAKYETELIDATGNPITIEEALTYKDVFIDLDTNYNLHADFLNYLYKEMQKLNQEFEVMAFND